MNRLTHQSPMPWGEFKGKPMLSMIEYHLNELHSIWSNRKVAATVPPELESVLDYIQRHRTMLSAVDNDRIW